MTSTIKKLSLETIVAEMSKLPSVPDVILKLSRMLEDPDITAEDLGQVIQLDPQLTAQMLKASNSSYYSLPRQISNMKEAVAILGQKTLKAQVYAILSHKMLNRKLEGYGLGNGDLWESALTGAVYAKKLAALYQYPDPETAFTVAVLRDIGKLVLHEYVGDIFKTLEKEAIESRQGFDEAERNILGFSHSELGEVIAKEWKFPERMVTAIRYHHKPSDASPSLELDASKLLGIVHLADSLCMMLGNGMGNDGMLYPVDLEYLNTHGFKVDMDVLQELMIHMYSCQDEIRTLNESIHT
ncbi:MAG: HDOD domain-containing protein [Vampirovibrio sp.]